MFPKSACVACKKAGLPRNFNESTNESHVKTWGASEKAHFHVLIANVLQGNEAGNGNDWWPTCPSSTSAHLGG